MSERDLTIQQHYDLCVIGGGVFGAALARQAAWQGYRVLLADAGDFGGATSANSLKTIHGGLRYLQGLDLLSSRASASERRRWLQLAPGLVKPLPCLLPTSGVGMRSRLVVGAGLAVYGLITADRNRGLDASRQLPMARLVSAENCAREAPGLELAGVSGAALWYDAQVQHTERLVYLLAADARLRGAECWNYLSVEGIEPGDQWHTVRLSDRLDSQSLQVRSRSVVDCSGGADVLAAGLGISASENYVTAVNLVIRRRLCDSAIGVNCHDEGGQTRALFLSPWRDSTLAGTWYFESAPGPAEWQGMLRQLNSLFPNDTIRGEDVALLHSGLLPAEPDALIARGPDSALLKHTRVIAWQDIDERYRGLYTLRGTKYTLALQAAREMCKRLAGNRSDHCPVAERLWSEEPNSANWMASLRPEQREYLMCYFRSALPQIASLAGDPAMLEPVPGETRCIRAVVAHCIAHEAVCHLVDLVVRRLPLGDETAPPEPAARFCLDLLASARGWDQERRQQEWSDLQQYYRERAYLPISPVH